ncbi:MAG: TetR-like C-terminal domain-containing protein [Rhodococcus sp. (in: high G+C Gram-positive bacteria)]
MDPFHALVLLNALFACATWNLAKPNSAATIAATTPSRGGCSTRSITRQERRNPISCPRRGLLHGFTTLEIAGSFQLGTDLDDSFDWMIDFVDESLSSASSSESTTSAL